MALFKDNLHGLFYITSQKVVAGSSTCSVTFGMHLYVHHVIRTLLLVIDDDDDAY